MVRYFRLAPPRAESRRRGYASACVVTVAILLDSSSGCGSFRHMALPRKRRFRTPRRWSEGLEDLHDYMHPPLTRASARASATNAPIVVIDDWPEQVPIGDAELRVIEGAFRKELDALFGPLP